jgi:hypothetical protein
MTLAREAAADYVAELAGELADIANRSGLDVAAYMLELAAAEARRKKRALKSGRRLTH